MGSGVSWYDILGVLPGASAEQIESAYLAKVALLGPRYVTGAPSKVLTAASRAQGMLDTARRVLRDPAGRERYDEATGIRRSGGGLAVPGSFPSQPGWRPSDFGYPGDFQSDEVAGVLIALTDWLTPHPRQPRRVQVPDVRGLFYSVCLNLVGRLDLRITAVRLTGHPLPVDGLIVDQAPRPPVKAHRPAGLTVQVWHPPARPPGS